MISIQNLTKKYKSKNKFDCVALDNISFDLPDSGMVFILGKSNLKSHQELALYIVHM